ncbi:MAG: A/G-specific adenine glycosylase [Anaerolineae bacterium]|nr:A/G-specific adenine glycosylase [Anaerolineae bacterium]MDW8299425.1 A/G-specific adenine glycosylase [Anaerolineae bacterium]
MEAVSEAFFEALLSWYARNAPDLPWRRSRDPYHIWLAEVMLQQTQVATVIPYYERFLAAFPTVQALAEAPLERVLKLWEGLGYYSRARNLHRAAQRVVAEHCGRLPQSVEALRKLHGIGRYTAGAIASIAFNQPAAALDGNVMRVLARLYDYAEPIEKPEAQRHLWQVAERMARAAPSGSAAEYTQAMMDLGRDICTPRAPRCAECPVYAFCRAHAAGTQALRPVRTPKAAVPHYAVGAAILYNDSGELLMARRPLDGLLGGLWEFPQGQARDSESPEAALQRALREKLALTVSVGTLLTKVRHAFTHFKITLHAYHCHAEKPEPRPLGYTECVWIALEDTDQLPISRADRHVIAFLRTDRARLF